MEGVGEGGMKMMSEGACYARQRRAHSFVVAGISEYCFAATLAFNMHMVPSLLHSVHIQCTSALVSFVPWQWAVYIQPPDRTDWAAGEGCALT